MIIALTMVAISRRRTAIGTAINVMILPHDPVDLIVLAVPVIAADPATEPHWRCSGACWR